MSRVNHRKSRPHRSRYPLRVSWVDVWRSGPFTVLAAMGDLNPLRPNSTGVGAPSQQDLTVKNAQQTHSDGLL